MHVCNSFQEFKVLKFALRDFVHAKSQTRKKYSTSELCEKYLKITYNKK